MNVRPPRSRPMREPRSPMRSCSGRSPASRPGSSRSAPWAARLPEFEALRDVGRDIRDHALANLDSLSRSVRAQARPPSGAHVHWAATAAEARDIILGICRAAGARIVTKGKSMISEEIGLNAHLEAAGLEVVETDLGEYIIQIRGETPSHIIAPAIHLTQDQIEEDFRAQPWPPRPGS